MIARLIIFSSETHLDLLVCTALGVDMVSIIISLLGPFTQHITRPTVCSPREPLDSELLLRTKGLSTLVRASCDQLYI